MNRRDYLRNAAILSGGLLLSKRLFGTTLPADKKTVMVLSGWQHRNIGDIAHTPGLLNLLNIYLPETPVILWARDENRAVSEMLLKKFPDVEIVNGPPGSKAVLAAAKRSDILIHGSGSGLPGGKYVAWWKENIKKPYGFYGISVTSTGGFASDLIRDASFIFTRETQSLEDMRAAGIECPIAEFSPDATFAMNLHDEQKAVAFMNSYQLEPGKFICVVPRLRKTPYYLTGADWSDERIKETNELNDKHKEVDHAKAREAITKWVRQTGQKVLVCPEMTYQLEIMDELLIDPLPSDVKGNVIKRDTYWLCDEASTVYKNAFAVLSFECHSPIMALYNGTPAFYLRQPEDTIKGQMYYDIGLSDWVFEIEETTGNQIADRLMQIYDDYPAAERYLEAAMDKVRQLQLRSMTRVRGIIQ